MNADPKQTHIASTFDHDHPLISCRFDPTGRYVFAGAEDSGVWRWEIKSGKKTEFAKHDSWVRAIAFSRNGETTVTGGYDGRLTWSASAAEKPSILRTVEAHDGWIRAAAANAAGDLLASAGNDGLVKIWNMNDGSLVRQLNGHEAHVYNVAFHPDGNDLISGDLTSNFIHWNVADGKEVRRFQCEPLQKYDKTFRAVIGGPRGMDFSRAGDLLAVSGITNVSNAFAGVGNPMVVLFDWKTGKEKIQQLSKGKLRGVGWNVRLHPQDYTIAVSGGGGGGYLLFWKYDAKEEFHQLKLPNTARDFDLHADGLLLAVAHYDRKLRLCKMTPKENTIKE